MPRIPIASAVRDESNGEDAKKRTLIRSDLFGALSEETLAEFAAASAAMRVEKRGRLAAPGHLFVLGAGRVRLVRAGHDERVITLGYFGPGDVVGEEAILEGPSTGDIVACEQVEAVRIPGVVVRRLWLSEPKFAARIAMRMIERRMALENRLVGFLLRSVESRVAEFLLESAERHGVPDPRGTLIGVKFTHQEIASYVGATRETVTLVLGELKRSDVIGIDHRRVILRDAERLKARI